MTELLLPSPEGRLVPYVLSGRFVEPVPGPWVSREVFAAAHVIADPLAPAGSDVPDWEATLAHRRYLWSLGFGVAEAMDTAQRGSGLGKDHIWPLIRRTAAEARSSGGRAVFGVTTDDLDGPGHSIEEIVASYEEQMELLEDVGGQAIIMPSRALALTARSPDDYLDVYQRLIDGSRSPVMVHWLGEMFDPALSGYWGHEDPWEAAEVVLGIIRTAPDRVSGIKVSVLDEELEVDFRRRLDPGVRCFTGDDFNFPRLIAGEGGFHSDALLGIFDVIAPVAANALHRLDAGDRNGFLTQLGPTVPLSRHLFAAPTHYYKTGVVFLSYITGHQARFQMLGGQETSRSLLHLSELLRLADGAGLIADPDLAAARMGQLLDGAGDS
jgi:hypothetical protein